MTYTPDPYTKIPMTGRAPVRIVTADWPILFPACEWSDNPRMHWNAPHRATLNARRHADGRTLVYAATETTTDDPVQYAGELLKQDCKLIETIQRCAEAIGHPQLALDAIAKLPPEDLE